jgi:cob(I)alamin adenosyltransferase
MKGLIHVYTGDGKGKTTAALGLALRAAGCGKRIVIVQFFKGRDSGELRSLESIPNVTVLRLEKDELAMAGACDMLIQDEIISAYDYHAVDRERLEKFLEHKPEVVELVLTGRDAPPKFLERADYVTEMRKRKHPFDQGITAREGIEF